MFNSFYKFRYCNFKDVNFGKYKIKKHVLIFKNKKNIDYIVHVEEYPLSVFVIKFFLKSHVLSDKRYNILTNFQEPTKIIRTCIEIMKYFLDKNPKASFAFIGTNTVKEDSKSNTKRFKVYGIAMKLFFDSTNFSHIEFEEDSIYLILNKQNNAPNLYDNIKEMLFYCYKLK